MTMIDRDVEDTITERGQTYGDDPRPNHDRIAQMWSAVLGVPITAQEVALCMVMVKASRLVASPDHEDSAHDLVGYARIVEMLQAPPVDPRA